MAYKFICPKDNCEHKYQLALKGWLWNSKHDVYLDINAVGRLELCVSYKGRNLTSKYTSSAEAKSLVEVLNQLGIKKSDLQNAEFPDTASQKIHTDWENIVTWLFALNNYTTLK